MPHAFHPLTAQEVGLSESQLRESLLLPGGSETLLYSLLIQADGACVAGELGESEPQEGGLAEGGGQLAAGACVPGLVPSPQSSALGRGGEERGGRRRAVIPCPQREQKQPSFCFKTSGTGSFTAHQASEFLPPRARQPDRHPHLPLNRKVTKQPPAPKHKPPARFDRSTNETRVRKQALPHPGDNRPPVHGVQKKRRRAAVLKEENQSQSKTERDEVWENSLWASLNKLPSCRARGAG